MKRVRRAAEVPRLLRPGPAGPPRTPRPQPEADRSGERPRNGPVVVLAYAHAGGARLQEVLSEHPDLACTSGTGVLPLCEHALGAWRRIEEWPSEAAVSPLAATSVRSVVATMLTVLAARSGRSRWCETATVSQEAAQSFLAVFPEARFVCLHRPCDGFIRAALAARPWGLSGPAFAPYTAAYPGSTVAALAAYWVAHTGPSLDFEAAHPQQCVRVHFDDLDSDPRAVMRALAQFLELGQAGPALRPPEDSGVAGSESTDVAGAPAVANRCRSARFPHRCWPRSTTCTPGSATHLCGPSEASAGSSQRRTVAIIPSHTSWRRQPHLHGLPPTGGRLHSRMTTARGGHHPEVITKSGT